MKKEIKIALICVSIVMILPATVQAKSKKEEKAKKAINEVMQTYFNQTNAGNSAEIIKLYTEDAISMGPFAPSLVGVEKIGKEIKATHAQIDFDMSFVVKEIIVSGDWAFARFEFAGTLALKSTGDSIKDLGKGMHILQKQKDGSWKIARHIANPSTPL